MFYELYSSIRSYIVTALLDNNWLKTTSIIHAIRGLNVTYAASSQDSIEERVARFKKLQNLTSAEQREENKKLFLEGLLVTDATSGRNILCETASDIHWNKNAFKTMLDQLIETSCFTGPNKQNCIKYFLRGLFAEDIKGMSAFLFAVQDIKFNSLTVLIYYLNELGAISGIHSTQFLNEIAAKNYYIFREATQKIDTYIALRSAMAQAGFTSLQLQIVLNTQFNEQTLDSEYPCTSLMRLIFATAANMNNNYAKLTVLLPELRQDGAILTAEQSRFILTNLYRLIHSPKFTFSLENLALLREWIAFIRATHPRIEDRIHKTRLTELPHHSSLFPIIEQRKSKPEDIKITVMPAEDDDNYYDDDDGIFYSMV